MFANNKTWQRFWEIFRDFFPVSFPRRHSSLLYVHRRRPSLSEPIATRLIVLSILLGNCVISGGACKPSLTHCVFPWSSPWDAANCKDRIAGLRVINMCLLIFVSCFWFIILWHMLKLSELRIIFELYVDFEALHETCVNTFAFWKSGIAKTRSSVHRHGLSGLPQFCLFLVRAVLIVLQAGKW